jgi:hypothetical protein
LSKRKIILMESGILRNIVGRSVLLCMALFFISKNNLTAQRMTDHLWKSRVLLLFSPDKKQADFQEQYRAFMGLGEEMQDRDLVVYQIFVQSGLTPQGKPLAREKIDGWRKKWEVLPKDFLLILVGKDGGTKYRSSKKIDPSVIFDLIDSMPMRQREMKVEGRRSRVEGRRSKGR